MKPMPQQPHPPQMKIFRKSQQFLLIHLLYIISQKRLLNLRKYLLKPDPALERSPKPVVNKTPPSHVIEEAPVEPKSKRVVKNEMKGEELETQTYEGESTPLDPFTPTPTQPAVMRSASTGASSDFPTDISIPVENPDIEAKFPGGRAALSMFIQKHVTYPKVAKENQKEGTVYIRFTVDDMGTIKDPKIIKGLGEAYDTEALSLIEKMPRWVPGKLQERSITTYKDLGIMYKIY